MSQPSHIHSLSNTSHSFSSLFPHSRKGPSSSSKSNLPSLYAEPFFSQYDKKWRWWHYLSVIILVIGLLESFALSLGYHLIQKQSSPIRIAVRQYPSLSYQHFNSSALSSTQSILQKGTNVYHVTKEFGPATVGGMGSVVTSLAAAQQRSGNTDVAVVMPYYSFLKNKYDIDKVVDLVIDLRDKHGKLVPIEFRVWKMMHVFSVPTPPATNTTISDPIVIARTERVPVYLIGPGNRTPFSQAFKCKSPLQIYSSPSGLPHEWRDQYFAKAASQFLTHRATAVDEESLFAPLLRSTPHVDVIHLHGATNAYLAKLLDDKRKANQLGATPPSIVYTMHDYLDELQYTNTVRNVMKFLDMSADDGLVKKGSDTTDQHVYGDRMFMSSLGIERADMVTFVSRTMATAMVEGTLDFYLKELVMDHLLLKAQQRRFFGISNGLDFTALNPFTAEKLVTRKLNYPDYAQQLLNQSTTRSISSSSSSSKEKYVWELGANSGDFIATAKDKAKRFLVRRHLLSAAGEKRPLVLYIGRFQYNKGLAWFDQAAQHFVDHNMTFIILGQEHNFPIGKLESLQVKYPDHVYVLSTPKQHRQWSIFCRAAADFVFVPSQTESFGLVAAEGLMFGASVISTGVGGLQEFLTDRPETAMVQQQGDDDQAWVPAYPQPRDIRLVRDKKTKIPTVTSGETYNAYLFNTQDGLSAAIRDAMLDYKRLLASKALREEYILRMMTSAMALGWDRQGKGPMHEYQHVYALALHQRSLPTLSRHEIEEDQVLLRRLQQTVSSSM